LEFTVAVALLVPELCGVNCKVNEQVPLAARIWLAAQVLPVTEKLVESVRLIDAALRVMEAPFAVTVTAAQVALMPTPTAVPQLALAGLTVSEAPVPLKENVVPDPCDGVTEAVEDSAPAVCGLKIRVPVVQDCPDCSVTLAQDPAVPVKSTPLVKLKGVAPKTTAPPAAVSVTDPVEQVPLEPTEAVPQASEVGEAVSDP
jgi:hypothetical protein